MKICILTASHDVSDERVFGREALSLKNGGYDDIILIAPHDKEYEEIGGIKVLGFKKRGIFPTLRKFVLLKDLYKKALQCKADAYHCHEPHTLAIGTWIKKKTGAKVIYDSHEYHPEQFAERFPPLIRQLVYILVYAMERYYARRADCVLTVCSELVERFRAWGCKAYLLPNYARNYESLYYADDPIVSRLKREGFTVGIFAGGMYKERGIFELIEAARILKERGLKVSMVFAGWGSSSFLRKVEKCIKHNCLDDRIKIVEKKDHRSIINMMSQCDFGFINDYPEKRNLNSIAVKVFEYMMCSLPIYASNLPLNSRVVDELCCGVTADPLVPERIADSLERLCSSREYMKGLGENSRKAFETRYNWQIVEGMLIGCYRNLEGGKDV